MIRVLELVPGLSMGGAEAIVKEYCMELDKNKFEIYVLCLTRYNLPYEQLLSENGVKVFYLSDYLWFKKSKNFFAKGVHFIQQKIFKYLLMRYFIRKIKPNVIHTHMGLNMCVRFARPRKPVAIFHTVHSEPKKLWDTNKEDYRATKWLLKNYDLRIITLHDDMRKDVNQMFGISNCIVLNNGIDFQRFEQKVDRMSYRKELGIPDNSFVVGHVGRFAIPKNHEFLVDVFKEIASQKDNAFLFLVGDGDLKEQIIQKLKNYSLLERTLILSNRTDIPFLMQCMDVLIFPSRWEGLSITLIEAQKTGLKCVVSDRVNKATTISNLVITRSIDTDSPKEWANAALKFNVSNIKYNAIEDWDMKNVIKKLENMYIEEYNSKCKRS